MDIASKYEGVLSNEEGHFVHHQMLQSDMIDSYKMHEATRSSIEGMLLQRKEMITLVQTLFEQNQILEQRINAICSAMQTKKKRHMDIQNLSAEFMYSGKSSAPVLSENVYPILDALLLEQGVKSDMTGICLAFIYDDNIVQDFMPIINKVFQVNLKKKQSGSCKVSFIYIDKEICMHELMDAQLEELSQPISDELTTPQFRPVFGEKSSMLMKIETCASS